MVSGIAVHAIQRGNNQAECFFDQDDRAFYLFHLARLLPRAQCQLHAYCLMSNHVHLLLSPARAEGCGVLMKSIGQLYTQYINRRYNRSGHLWQARFRSSLVQSEDYVLACCSYIELNPVRAGLARRPDEYPWSSYSANAMGHAAELLTPHAEYLRLGRAPEERQAVYRDLFGEVQPPRLLDEIRGAANGGYALGTTAFKRAMARTLGRRVDKGKAGRPPRGAQDSAQPRLAGTEKTWSVPD